MDVAKEIRILLANENLKVSDLARLMGTSHQNLTNILSKNNPTASKIDEIAFSLGYKAKITFEKIDK